MKITYIGPIYLLKINSITLNKQPLSLYWNTTEEKIKKASKIETFFGSEGENRTHDLSGMNRTL